MQVFLIINSSNRIPYGLTSFSDDLINMIPQSLAITVR